MQYEKRVIVFLDLLGFKDFIHFTNKTANNQNEKIQGVYDFFGFLRSILEVNSNRLSATKSKVLTHFSDLIVISFPANDFDSVCEEIRDVQIIIGNCISHGFFSRGSIIYGDIVHTPEIIFGPGLIEAYEVERTKSKYPRVLVDEAIVKDFHERKPSNSDLGSLLSIDEDGEYYVDFFKKIRPHLDHDEQYQKYILRMTKMLLDMSIKPNLREKLEWLFPKYHQMLIEINFINRPELAEFEIEDLWHIYETMRTEW